MLATSSYLLRLGIQCTGGLVQQQYLRVANECSRNRDALLLATGKSNALGSAVTVVTLGERSDQIRQDGGVACADDIFFLDLVFINTENNVVADRSCVSPGQQSVLSCSDKQYQPRYNVGS